MNERHLHIVGKQPTRPPVQLVNIPRPTPPPRRRMVRLVTGLAVLIATAATVIALGLLGELAGGWHCDQSVTVNGVPLCNSQPEANPD